MRADLLIGTEVLGHLVVAGTNTGRPYVHGGSWSVPLVSLDRAERIAARGDIAEAVMVTRFKRVDDIEALGIATDVVERFVGRSPTIDNLRFLVVERHRERALNSIIASRLAEIDPTSTPDQQGALVRRIVADARRATDDLRSAVGERNADV